MHPVCLYCICNVNPQLVLWLKVREGGRRVKVERTDVDGEKKGTQKTRGIKCENWEKEKQ